MVIGLEMCGDISPKPFTFWLNRKKDYGCILPTFFRMPMCDGWPLGLAIKLGACFLRFPQEMTAPHLEYP